MPNKQILANIVSGLWALKLLVPYSAFSPVDMIVFKKVDRRDYHNTFNTRLCRKTVLTTVVIDWCAAFDLTNVIVFLFSDQYLATCEDPGVPANGRRIGDRFINGVSVEFTCHENYSLIGSSTIRCLGGRWSSTLPECKGIKLKQHPFERTRSPSPTPLTKRKIQPKQKTCKASDAISEGLWRSVTKWCRSDSLFCWKLQHSQSKFPTNSSSSR